MCVYVYVTNLVIIILLLQKLHCLGLYYFPLAEGEKKERKKIFWLLLNFRDVPSAGVGGNHAYQKVLGD